MPASEKLVELMDLQVALERRTAALDDANAVLEVGAAVLAFAEREAQALFPLLPLLDPAAREELADEHARLAEDLELLSWLVTVTPDSADIDVLGAALGQRIRAHIARDGRLIAQAVRLREAQEH